MSSLEVETLNVESLYDKIADRIPRINGKEVSLRYLDNSNDWVELPSDDLDSFIDMVETAKQSTNRENLKVIELKVCELAQTPRSIHGSQKRPRESPSPSDKSYSSTTSEKPCLKSRCLEAEFSSTKPTLEKPVVYETPTQKYFNKLERDKESFELVVAKKQQEIIDVETTLKANKPALKVPLCSNCHTGGHNKTMCTFAPCTSATICKEIKRHPDEEKYYKAVKAELKESQIKLKKIVLDIASKKESFSASANTFAAKIQSRLIESNPDKYLRSTARNGEKVPNWLIVNTDIRKLERICRGKVPGEMEDIQSLINAYEKGFPGVYSDEPGSSKTQTVPNKVHPVVALWEKKGVSFPGKGIIPNVMASTEASTSASHDGLDPRLDLDGLDADEIEEELNADYGLSLLFRAANMNRE